LHSAQVLQMAVDGSAPRIGPYVESAFVEQSRVEAERSQRRGAAVLAIAALAGALLWSSLHAGGRNEKQVDP